MGLFSFIKDAGEKIFGGSEAKADELKKNLDAQGLDTKDIQVQVNGDQVELHGSVKDQATLEKAVLAVGNNAGVAGVKTDGITVNAPAEESVFYTVKSGDPASGNCEKDMLLARHNIDVLEMLRQKTLGRLEPQESSLLESLLCELRLKYVIKCDCQCGAAGQV